MTVGIGLGLDLVKPLESVYTLPAEAGWLPRSGTTSVVVHLNPIDLGTLSGGNSLSTWVDNGAGTLDFSQSTGSLQPLVRDRLLDNWPGIDLTTTASFLKSANATLAQPFTIYMLLKSYSTAGFLYAMGGTTVANGNGIQVNGASGDRYVMSFNFNIYSTSGTLPNDAFHLLECQINGASSSSYVDGTTISTAVNPGTNNLVTAGPIGLGARGDGSAGRDMHLVDFLILGGIPGGPERTKIYQDYYQAKYPSLSLTIP